MTDSRRCPNCSAELAEDLREALCPQCLMKLALSEGDREESETSSTTTLPSLQKDWENPEQIGPYRILQTLGEGGMGIVYLAEQREPIRRRVALKVIKLGMDTKEVIARFESERQALALMNHPNIAKVLDAGSTESGRPYFVMDYVSGTPITEYCDDHRLDTKARLRLFLPVCKAIEHAHQKGIIHRDIKPSNVLVELQDGERTPKVIDFGVSKATNQRLTERTIFTQRGVLIGTHVTKASQEGARAVIFASFFGSDGPSTEEFASSIRSSKCPVILETVTTPSLDPEWTILPAGSLIAAGAQTGFSHLQPDIDSVVRRTRLFAQGAPSLVAQTYSLVVGSPLDVDRLPIAGYQDSDPEILINFHGGRRHTRTTSYGVALDKPASFFHDKIILVGRFPRIAVGKGFATPFSSDPREGQPTEYTATLSLMTQVEVQANVLSTLLSENFIYTPGPLAHYAAALLMGFLVSFVTLAVRPGSLAVPIVSGGIAAYLILVAMLFDRFSLWVGPAAPLCVLLLSLALTLVYREWRA